MSSASDSICFAADVREYALFLVGLDGDVRCWNPARSGSSAIQSAEIIGQHFSRLFSPEDIRSGQPEHELKTALADRSCGQLLLADSEGWHAVLVPGHHNTPCSTRTSRFGPSPA